jgi:hypothetical protein
MAKTNWELVGKAMMAISIGVFGAATIQLEWHQPMVKRRKEENIAGVLEFAGPASEDAEFMEWIADHKARNLWKIRVGQGAKGIRVMFTKETDMALWKARLKSCEGQEFPPS